MGKCLKGNFRALFQVKSGTVLGQWRQVATIAYAAGDVDLAVDEIGFLCKNGSILPDCKGDEPMLYKVVFFGRHRNVRLIATTQSPPNMALAYRSMSDEFRIFQTTEPAHLKYLSERIGERAASLLPTLPKYAFVVWRADGQVIVVQPKGAAA